MVQGIEHGGACWSALSPLPANLCERVKTGLRAVRSAAGPHPRSGVPIPSDFAEAVFSTLSTNTLDETVTRLDPNAPLTDYDVRGNQYPQTPSRSQFRRTACRRSTSCNSNNPFHTSETPGSSSKPCSPVRRLAASLGTFTTLSETAVWERSVHGGAPGGNADFVPLGARKQNQSIPHLRTRHLFCKLHRSAHPRFALDRPLLFLRICALAAPWHDEQRCATPASAQSTTGGSGSSSSSCSVRAWRSVSTVRQ